MPRAYVQQTLSNFFDRAACATVADEDLLTAYISSLDRYIEELEETFDPIDEWSVNELERVYEYVLQNRQWILGSDRAIELLATAQTAIDLHKDFLTAHGLLPDYLLDGPGNSFKV